MATQHQQPGCLAGLFRWRRHSESPSPGPDDGPSGRPGRTPTPAVGGEDPPSPSASLPPPASSGGHARIGSGVDLHTLLAHVMPSKEAAIKVAPVAVGGEARSDGQVAYGYSLMRGRRATMEDFHHAAFHNHPDFDEPVGLFAVFDGHGGPHAADFVKKHLASNLLSHPKFGTDPVTALEEAFAATDAAYLETAGGCPAGNCNGNGGGSVGPRWRSPSPQRGGTPAAAGGEPGGPGPGPSSAAAAAAAACSPTRTPPRLIMGRPGHTPPRDDGCTAVVAVLVGTRLLVAHVGDSRAVLVRGLDAIPLSQDHKPDRRDERARIERAGGAVVWAGAWRVGGVLAVSRAFGDRALKPYVCADPDVRDEALTPADAALVLASDGLWDVMSNAEAAALAAADADPKAAARALTTEALARGSADNVSAVVVRLRPRGGSLDGAAEAAAAVAAATAVGRGPGGPAAAAAAIAAAAGGAGGGPVRRVVPSAGRTPTPTPPPAASPPPPAPPAQHQQEQQAGGGGGAA